MNKKRKTSANGVKKKLMGAVCMLLVASIMMISATYAWFTLSTAPEITGITTSVGANGSLEMALLNSDTYADMTKIKSAVGDSMANGDVKAANITWGNLVDLSSDTYGLQNIKLMPARWNTNTDTGAINADSGNYLLTPKYGADGRVTDVSGTTMGGAWDENSWSATGSRGVRAVASTDALSAQAAGLMSAKNDFNSLLNTASATVKKTLTDNMQGLADAVIKIAQNKDPETDEINAVKAMLGDTSTALAKIDLAYKAVLKAYAASAIADETTYSNVVSAIDDAATAKLALDAIKANVTALDGTTAIGTAIAALEAQKGNVTDPKTVTNADTCKAALDKLVNTDVVKVNNMNKTEIYVGGAIADDFVNAVFADGVVVTMPNDSGVFAYIGTVVGNYQAKKLYNTATKTGGIDLKYNKLTVHTSGTVETSVTVDTNVRSALNGITAAQGTGSNKLADVYGYALEMAFRTNAANSYLQLSKDGIQRVYNTSTSADTMGAGSTMTFKAADNSELTDTQVGALMRAIRVTFVPGNGDDPKTAVLDVDNAKVVDGGLEAGLKLCGHTFDSKGAFNGTALTDKAENDGKDESVDLMQMTQNTAQKMTVVVWLDGDQVDNSMVANALESITGSLNLQFKSSAELKPMDNTALKDMASNYTLKQDQTSFDYNTKTYEPINDVKIYTSSTNSFLYFSKDNGVTYTRITDRNIDQVGTLKTNPGP